MMFVYFIFPNYIAECMTFFSWMAWIAPKNQNLANITGSLYGLGLNPVPSFDWNLFASGLDPLMGVACSAFYTRIRQCANFSI